MFLFQLRITVWSLTSKSVSYIKYPKACVKGKITEFKISKQDSSIFVLDVCVSLPPATKWQEGDVFTPVCDSVQGVSDQGGLCPGEEGVSVRETLPPLYGNVRAVRILLECILD